MEQVLKIHQTRDNIIKGDRVQPVYPPLYSGQMYIGTTNRVFVGDLNCDSWIELITANTPQ